MLDLIKNLALRLQNPEYVSDVIMNPNNQIEERPFKDTSWRDFSLSNGYAGMMLLFSELDRLFPDEHWNGAVHTYVLKIKEQIESERILNFSLFGGLAGVCFAFHQSSHHGNRYQKLINTLNLHLVKEVEKTHLVPLETNLKRKSPSSNALYDLMQGIIGIGIYILNNLLFSPLFSLLEKIIQNLVQLIQPIEVGGKVLPGWYMANYQQLSLRDKALYPEGNFNLGLAHGASGILSFLSIALLKGIHLEGQKEAIEKLSVWIQEHRQVANHSFFWEPVVSFKNEIHRTKNSTFGGRDAWCYGTPGVASSLLLAGKALNDDKIKQFAIDSFASVFKRSPQEWNLPGPTFCHGISGLLFITQQFAKETQSLDLKEKVQTLKENLMQFYDPSFSFGFKDYFATTNGNFIKMDNVGFLEGAVGILLVMLSLECETSWWHAPFLITDK